jgi:predicted Rossmann fold nucleotide-binding protein DprA/Smf involved in DNA uptake
MFLDADLPTTIFIYDLAWTLVSQRERETMSEKPKIKPEKAKEMQERAKERNLIIKEMKKQDSSTVDSLAKATGMEKALLVKHLIAMRQFGKISVVGERDHQLVYSLPKYSKS